MSPNYKKKSQQFNKSIIDNRSWNMKDSTTDIFFRYI